VSFALAFRSTVRELTGMLTGIKPGSVGDQILRGVFPGASGTPPIAGTRERMSAFATTPWLHAVADKVASSFSAIEWRLYVANGKVRPGQAPGQPPPRAIRSRQLQKAGYAERSKLLQAATQAGELTPIEDHVMLDALDSANPYQTGHAMRKTWMLHYDLAGDAFLMKERNGMGAPIGLWPLPPHWITRTPTPTIRSYRVAYRGFQTEVPDTEVLWISNPNPENPYGRGVGLTQALADEIETDEYAAKTSRQIFFNQARPDFLVFPKGEIPWSEAALERLKADWMAEHQGFWRVSKPKFVTREIGVHEFDGANLRNLQMVPLREFERDVILQTWGVPPEIMGILESSNRATIAAAGYLYARWVLVPRLEFFRAALQERLVPEYDDRLILDYASPVEDDAELGLEAAKVAPWALDVNEWRRMAGHAPTDEPWGELHAMPGGTRYGELTDPPPAPLVPVGPDGEPVRPMGPSGGPPKPGAPGKPKPKPKDFSALTTTELLDLRRLVGKMKGDD